MIAPHELIFPSAGLTIVSRFESTTLAPGFSSRVKKWLKFKYAFGSVMSASLISTLYLFINTGIRVREEKLTVHHMKNLNLEKDRTMPILH